MTLKSLNINCKFERSGWGVENKLHTRGGWYNTILREMCNGKTTVVFFVITPCRMLTIGVKCYELGYNVVHHNYILHQVISDTTVCQWLATSRWFSPDSPVSYSYNSYHQDVMKILLIVALIAITLTLLLTT